MTQIRFMSNSVGKMRTGFTLLVAGYWLALFVATHVPRIPAALTMPGADKWQHLAAYAILALLLAARQSLGQRLNGMRLCRIAAIVAVYGVFDELTQIPVGRHADVKDWYADVVGCMLGLAVFAMVRAILARFSKPRAG